MNFKRVVFVISILLLSACNHEKNIHLLCKIKYIEPNITMEQRYHVDLNFNNIFNYYFNEEGTCKIQYKVLDDIWGMDAVGTVSISEEYYVCNSELLDSPKDSKPLKLIFKINRFTGSVASGSGKSTYFGSCKKILRKY